MIMRLVNLLGAGMAVGLVAAIPTVASAQSWCSVPQQYQFPCRDGLGCIVWVTSHYCTGSGSGTTCGCVQQYTCCGLTVNKYDTHSCGNLCVGCDQKKGKGDKRAAQSKERPRSAMARTQPTARQTAARLEQSSPADVKTAQPVSRP
jgi:hypothetical protein